MALDGRVLDSTRSTGLFMPFKFSIFPISDGVPTLCLIASTPAYIVADILLKKTSDTGVWGYFAASLALTLIANLLFLQVIKDGLATGYMISVVLMTLGVVGAGVFLFGESWNVAKGTALILLVAATALLALPENQSATAHKGA